MRNMRTNSSNKSKPPRRKVFKDVAAARQHLDAIAAARDTPRPSLQAMIAEFGRKLDAHIAEVVATERSKLRKELVKEILATFNKGRR